MVEIHRHESYFDSSRGRLIAELRCGSHTVDELAHTLGVTHNAIRLHLQALERDGLVRLAGTRRPAAAGKPAHIYEMVAGAEERFSRAYAPMLGAVLQAMTAELDADTIEAILRKAGRAIAGEVAPALGKASHDPIKRVMRFITDLGGQATVERRNGTVVLRGCGCILSSVTRDQPVMCRAVATILSEVTGTRVREECERGERVNCRFRITLPRR
jgi:predicted ArsR family transcriptional regulator